MLDKDGKRMLAYIQEVASVEPIVGADNIEKAHVLGWTLIIKKGEFKPGDKCVFFEIDSKVPETNPAFAFLSSKHYKIKTYKLNRFGVISQGLALPLADLGIEDTVAINDDMTDRLGVTYAIPEDNFRKTDVVEQSRNSYMNKHKKFFSNTFVRKLMHLRFFRWLFLLGANKGKRDMRKAFPSEFVQKTDEERIQNMPWVLQNKTPLVATEKLDGTSTTWLLVRKNHRFLFFKKSGFEFYVCSRNVRMFKPDQKTFSDVDGDNIYWENALKYDVEARLTQYLKENPDLKWVCIQGESYGEGWQGNPLKQKGHHFAAFNFKDSKNGRWGSMEGKALLEKWGIPWVPILDENFILPDTVEELLTIATAKSKVNPEVLREGIVFRGKDGVQSFKAVSPEYLIQKGE
jgi:hypothetical protein